MNSLSQPPSRCVMDALEPRMLLSAAAPVGTTFHKPILILPPSRSGFVPVFGDFNGDGFKDFAYAAGSYAKVRLPDNTRRLVFMGRIHVRLNNGNGTFREAWVISTGESGADEMLAADMNHDGKDDLIAWNKNIALMTSLGDGRFTPYAPIASAELGSPGESVCVGDFNGDSHPDVAASGYRRLGPDTREGANVESQISVHFGDGAGGLGGPVYTHIAGKYVLRQVAFSANEDGRDDLLVVAGNSVKTLVSKGDGTFDFPHEYQVDDFLKTNLVEFDGDSDPDLMWVSSRNSITLASNDGRGLFSRRTIRLPLRRFDGFRVADFNVDGRNDLVIYAGRVARIFLAGTDGTFTPVADKMDAVAAGYILDMNGDGLLDLLSGSVLRLAKRPPVHLMPDGTVVVTGTRRGDRVVVSRSGETMTVSLRGTPYEFSSAAVRGLRMSTGGGSDVVTIEAGVNVAVAVSGGVGDDTISGGGGPDTIRGDGGNDVLVGGLGADQVWGGVGADVFGGSDDRTERKDFGAGDSILAQ